MTFEMVRIGWPNLAAVLALAVLPMVALATGRPAQIDAAAFETENAAVYCPASDQDVPRFVTLVSVTT